MQLGFAGSIHGMTPEQLASLTAFVQQHATDITEFRCAGCRGADEQAAEIVSRLTSARLIIHRQRKASIESPLLVAVASEVHPPASHSRTKRNAPVVDPSDVILLAPRDEHTNGGTMASFRYARWLGKPLVLIWHNGLLDRRTYTPAPLQLTQREHPKLLDVATPTSASA